MKVAILQRDIVWADPAANLARADESIGALADDIGLILLPEMFATGFAIEPDGVAEAAPGPILAWMQRTAARRGCAVAGSVAVGEMWDGRWEMEDCATDEGGVAGLSGAPVPEGNRSSASQAQFSILHPPSSISHQPSSIYRNRFYFVRPDGSVAHYDKHHLFSYGGEQQHYTAGQERVVVEWGGIRFLLQVCYDLRFPVWSRNRADYDCTLYVASWPTSRQAAWTTLLHARAIENQCYVLGANRVGTDPACTYSGGSVIIDPYGRDLAACPCNEECAAVAELDMDALRAFRKKFPVLNDRDI